METQDVHGTFKVNVDTSVKSEGRFYTSGAGWFLRQNSCTKGHKWEEKKRGREKEEKCLEKYVKPLMKAFAVGSN